jgi:hypothetical protein
MPPPFRLVDAESTPLDVGGCRRIWAVVTVAVNTRMKDALARQLMQDHFLAAERKFYKVNVALYRPREFVGQIRVAP